jgi:hypothetical protein
VGCSIYIFLLVQFWRRGRQISTPEAGAAWRAAGGVEDIKNLALGLECGMVAFLASAYFYNQLYTSWFFTFIIANTLLWSVAVKNQSPRPAVSRRLIRASK